MAGAVNLNEMNEDSTMQTTHASSSQNPADATSNVSAAEIAKEALHIAASICIYTNENITVETIPQIRS